MPAARAPLRQRPARREPLRLATAMQLWQPVAEPRALMPWELVQSIRQLREQARAECYDIDDEEQAKREPQYRQTPRGRGRPHVGE